MDTTDNVQIINDIYTVVKKLNPDGTMSSENYQSIFLDAKKTSKKILFIIPDKESFHELRFHLKSSLADYKQESCDEGVDIPLDELDTGMGRTILVKKAAKF